MPAVELRVYDPIQFVSSPNPTVFKLGYPDSCGRFALTDVPPPSSNFVAVATANYVDPGTMTTPFGDLFVRTGIASPFTAGQTFAGLRAKRQPGLLHERGRHADHRRGRIVDPPDRVQVVPQRIAGGGFDHHPGAVRL